MRGLGCRAGVALAMCAVLGGCARSEGEAADSAPAQQRSLGTTPPEASPAVQQDTPKITPPGPRDTRPWVPVMPDTFRAPAQPGGAPGASGAPAQGGEWTAGVVERKRPEMAPVVLRSIRTARHEGWDRVVFEFAGGKVPGYHLEYVDRPIVRCGSGHATEVAGEGWLEVRLMPAQAHTEQGEATVRERERTPSLPVLRELEMTCDFEADVTVVLGVASPNRYRVTELSDPARLVVDVRH